MAGSLRFVVEVASDQATQALTAIATAANQAGVQIRASLAGVGPAAQGAASGITGLKGAFHEFHGSMRTGHRLAVEFGNILGTMGNEAGVAGRALGSMLGGLAVGGPMGLAIGGVMALVEHFRTMEREAEVAAKAQAEIGR